MITASPDGGFDHCYLHASYSAQQTVTDESMDGRTTAVYTEALTPAMVSQRLHGGCILRHSGTPWQDARGKLRRTLKRMRRRRAGSNYTVRDQYNMHATSGDAEKRNIITHAARPMHHPPMHPRSSLTHLGCIMHVRSCRQTIAACCSSIVPSSLARLTRRANLCGRQAMQLRLVYTAGKTGVSVL